MLDTFWKYSDLFWLFFQVWLIVCGVVLGVAAIWGLFLIWKDRQHAEP